MKKKLIRVATDFIDKFQTNYIMTWSASLAFYTALSLGPILILFLLAISLFDHQTQSMFVQEAQLLFGRSAVKMIFENISLEEFKNSLSGMIALGMLIFSASILFAQIRDALDVIHENRPQKPEGSALIKALFFLKTKIIQIVMAVAFVFILLISLSLTILLNTVVELDISYFQNVPIVFLLNTVFSLLIYFAVFVLLFKYGSSRTMPWKKTLFCASAASILFVIGKEIIGLVLGRNPQVSFYGAAGSVVILLLWVYYSSVMVLASAQLGQSLYGSDLKKEKAQ